MIDYPFLDNVDKNKWPSACASLTLCEVLKSTLEFANAPLAVAVFYNSAPAGHFHLQMRLVVAFNKLMQRLAVNNYKIDYSLSVYMYLTAEVY